MQRADNRIVPVYDVVHLTVLTPARHVRIFHSALTQAQAGFRVAIVGPDSAPAPYQANGVKIIPLAPFGRLTPARLLAPKRLLRLALAHPARAYTLHTPELLGVGWALHWQLGSAIVYDVHEDYALNLRYGPSLPTPFRWLAARLVRRQELAAQPWLAQVHYAETVFENILQAKSSFVFRNLYDGELPQPKIASPLADRPLRLVHTGTLAAAWGVWQALEIWKILNQLQPTELTMAGFAPKPRIITQIESRVKHSGLQKYFTLLGGKYFLPHGEVMAALAQADASLALYQPLPQFVGRVPTKFYEAMAHQVPVLFSPQPDWVQLNDRLHFGMPTQTDDLPEAARQVLKAAQQGFPACYPHPIHPSEYSWRAAAPGLLKATEALIGPPTLPPY